MWRFLTRRLRALFRRRELDKELDEELRFHLEREIEQYRARGLGEHEARTAALRAFGGLEQTKERARDARGVRPVDELWQDLRHGWRMMRRTPRFTAMVALTLALGVGASTTMFSVVDGVLLRPLPFPDSERLVRLDETVNGDPISVSHRDFLDWQTQQDVFQAMGVYYRGGFTLAGRVPQSLASARISAGALAALGVKPALGRSFNSEDERPGAPAVALLSHGFWRDQLGGDPSILNRQISAGGPIAIGVMPPGFAFPAPVSLWEPPDAGRARTSNRSRRLGSAIARLRPDVTLEQARAALTTIAARLAREFPDTNRNVGVRVERLLDSETGHVRRALWILLAGSALVLLIACANVAGLLLARAVSRWEEMAVRAALGAGRWRLLRQVLTESILLAAVGSAAGVALAGLSLRLVTSLGQGRISRLAEVGLDGRVLAFSVAIALLTGAAAGVAPAWRASRPDLATGLKGVGRVTGRGRIRQGLVVAQVALTLVLLAGAGLLLETFRELAAVNPGFSARDVLTFRWGLAERKHPLGELRVLYERWLSEVRSLPGVDAASFASQIPLDIDDPSIANRLGHAGARFLVEGQPEPPPAERPALELRFVEPEYFRVMGIPIMRGRGFTAQDGENDARIAVVDEASARRYWPREDPIGRRIRLTERGSTLTVVGVVGRVKLMTLREESGPLQAYIPFRQSPSAGGVTIVVRSRLPPAPLLVAARRLAAALDPDQPVTAGTTFDELTGKHLAPERLSLLLVGAFAAIALVLALVGLYGVLAYSVAQRRRELAVRVALGARAAHVVRLVVGQGMLLAMVGIALGLAGAIAVTRVLGALLYGVTPTDPPTFAAVTALLLLLALLASYLPARRAARIDPMMALRQD